MKTKNKRFVVVNLNRLFEAWSVEDTKINKTKAVFYDEASEALARDFCRQINKAIKQAPPRE